jgi:hypothetical protein
LIVPFYVSVKPVKQEKPISKASRMLRGATGDLHDACAKQEAAASDSRLPI